MLTLEPPGVSYSASPDPGVSVYVLCKLVVFFKSYDDFEGKPNGNYISWQHAHMTIETPRTKSKQPFQGPLLKVSFLVALHRAKPPRSTQPQFENKAQFGCKPKRV